MKKLLIALTILTLIFGLSSCKGNSGAKSEEGATLLVWESKEAELEFMKQVAADFEAKYKIKVIVENVEHTDSGKRIAQDGPAGTGADVFAAPHDHTGNLVMSGLVLENAYEKEIKENMIEAAVTAVSFNGKVYGYPRAIETYALFYNKDILKEAPKTYDELIAFGKTYTNVKENKYAFYMDVDNAYFVQSFLAGGGGYVFGNGGTDAKDVGLDNDGAISGISDMIKLKEILPLKSTDADYVPMMGLFNEGKVGAIITGPWEIANLRKSKLNWGVAQLPKLSGGKDSKPFSGVRALYVSAYSKYPNAAQLFAKFYCEEENQRKRFIATGQIPTDKKAMTMKEIETDFAVAGIANQAKFSSPMPSIPEIQLFWAPMGAAYGIIWNGEVTVEKGLKDAAAQIRKDVENQ